MAARGRPTLYRPEYAQQAEKACAEGATNADLAELFKVTVSTVQLWLTQHAEFSESVKRGRAETDDRVVKSLYQRAITSDTTAAIFWLKNRRPAEWRDRQEHAVSGNITVTLTPKQADL